jgi:TldD protein
LVSLEEKLHFTQELLSIPKNQSLVTNWSVNYSDRYVQKWFLASDQVEFEQDYNQAGVRLGFTLKQGDQIFDDRASVWFMTPQNQLQFSQKIFSEAIKEATFFLSAETITPGKYSVLLSPEITGVFTHESFGHKSEADFMLGDEAMLKEWEMGKDVAAPWVSIVDEGHSALTSGYCPIDDEGNEKEKTYLIKNGKLAGRLHNAFTAAALGEKNTGNGRALNFEYPPMVRMTNTYIEAGDQSLQEVIRGVKKGLYIKDFKHGMGMSTFTIAPTKSYWIEDGKITKPVRISVISGSVFETLKNISAISNDFEIHSSAFGGCGKNDQSPLSVADGGPSILVDGMQVS